MPHYTTENVAPVAYSIDLSKVTAPRRERAISQIMKRYELEREYAEALLEAGVTLHFSQSLEEQGIVFEEEDTTPEPECWVFVDPINNDYVVFDGAVPDETPVFVGSEDGALAYMEAHPLDTTLGGVPPEAPSPEMHAVENEIMSTAVSHPTKQQLISMAASWKHDPHFVYALLQSLEGECLRQCGDGSNLFKYTFKA